MKHVTSELIRERLALFSRKLLVCYGDENQGYASKGEPLDDVRRLLVEAGAKRYRPISLCYHDAGLHAENAVRAKDALVRDGLFREWKSGWAHRGSGGHPCFLELLPAGEKVLLDMGIKPFEPRGKGEFRARVYQNAYLPCFLEKRGYRYELEYDAGSKQVDVVYWDEYSRIHAVEICASGGAEQNADAGLRCAAIDGVYRVLLACEKRELMKGIKHLLGMEMPFIQERVQVNWLGEYWPWRNDDEMENMKGVRCDGVAEGV